MIHQAATFGTLAIKIYPIRQIRIMAARAPRTTVGALTQNDRVAATERLRAIVNIIIEDIFAIPARSCFDRSMRVIRSSNSPLRNSVPIRARGAEDPINVQNIIQLPAPMSMSIGMHKGDEFIKRCLPFTGQDMEHGLPGRVPLESGAREISIHGDVKAMGQADRSWCSCHVDRSSPRTISLPRPPSARSSYEARIR